MVSVKQFLEEKWQRDIEGDPNNIKLFKDNEKFNIEKVLWPPKEHFEAVK